MRILTSLALVAIVLTLPWTVLAAPARQSSVDIKSLALAKGDLPRGFDVVPDRTVSEERPDGVAVYDVTYARERTPENLTAGPFEVRSGVARTAQADDAKAQLASTRDAFVAEGWADAPVPALGDEKIGLTQTTDGEGGKLVHYAYLFRKGSLILMIGIRGRPDVTKMDDAVAFAILVSGRVDKALGSGAAPASSTGSQPARPTAGRVKVVNTDGGSANVRSDPSTDADVVAQVAEGTVLDLAGPDRDTEGRTWRNVKTSDGQTGWIASTLTETVAAPAAAPAAAPSPAPSPAAAPPPSSSQNTAAPAGGPPGAPPPPDSGATPADAGTAPADTAPADAPPPPPAPAPSPQAGPANTAAPSSAPASGSSAVGRGSGNGLVVEVTVRDATLSSGTQLVKVHVTSDGGGNVEGAFVDVTAKLDANRFRAIRLPRTSVDGWTEIEWDMEGPPGTYQVIADARTDENGPATTATTSFRWK